MDELIPFPDDAPLMPVNAINEGLDKIEAFSRDAQIDALQASANRLLVAASPFLESQDEQGIKDLKWDVAPDLQRSIWVAWGKGWELGGEHTLIEMRAAIPEATQRELFQYAIADELAQKIWFMLRLSPSRIANTPAEQAIQDRVFRLAGHFSLDTLDALKVDLLAAVQRQPSTGAPIDRDQLLARIEKTLNVSSVRADTIARTELTTAYNTGRVTTASQSELVEAMRFLAISDARTTPICRSRNGMLIPMSDQGAIALNRPALHIRCRSTLSPVLPRVNAKHQAWIDDPERDYSKRELSPLPEGWRV